ncbi:MAG: SDR family NAD(P)-dependent oxidoreductase [Parachlamydiaceae bacterium]|nr:SDR family NAD(P)-dependent oxidoreductase [Parachlamydiaceae bacterium]
MNLELQNKIVLISASGQGLGRGIAESFLKEKAKVVITDIHEDRLNSTLDELKEKYDVENIFLFCGNMINKNDISNCVNLVVKRFGRIDILVANLGSGVGTSDWNVSEDDWNNMLDINFTGARRIVNEVLPTMIENKSGSIVFISSIAGIEVIETPIHYSVAKAALIAFSKNLARKIAKNNIRVNTICPGNIYFENGIWDNKLKVDREKVLEMLEKSVPLNRFASPEEIANLVLLISSDKMSFMTGSCLVIDGGQTVTI